VARRTEEKSEFDDADDGPSPAEVMAKAQEAKWVKEKAEKERKEKVHES